MLPAQFDQGRSGAVAWQAVAPGDVAPLQKELQLLVRPSLHWRDVPPEQVQVGAYTVQRVVASLRPELQGRPQAELDAIRLRDGRASLMTTRTDDLLTFSGDTPLMPAEAWGRPQLLIHESTFLDDATAADAAATRYNRHSGLPGVLDTAHPPAPPCVVFTPFSFRPPARADTPSLSHQQRPRAHSLPC